MADDLSPEQRSYAMSRVRSRGNKTTELRLQRLLGEAGLTGWKLHASVAGKPDFVFELEKVAVFVDGCFWHGCPRCYRRPATNTSYWTEKVARNRRRDRRVTRQLRVQGWRVFRVWEHSVGARQTVTRIKRAIAEAQAKYQSGAPE